MDEQEVSNFVFSPEVISALGAMLTLIVGSFATVINRQMSAMNKRVVVLENDIEEKDDELRTKNKALMDNQALVANVQAMYSQSLQQLTELNNSTRVANQEIAKLQKQLTDVNSIILDQQNQIKKYVEEIQRLQPFEDLAHARNGEIKQLTERLTELERKYDIEIAKRQGAIEALKALDVIVNEVSASYEAVKQPTQDAKSE